MPLYRFGKHIKTGESGTQSPKRVYTTVMILTVIACIPIVVYIYLTIQLPPPVAGKTINKGYYDPYLTFTTDWFTFRTDNGWEEVKELTKPDILYTYRQKSGLNPQGLLQIYVNNASISGGEDHFSRVLPVVVKDGTSLITQPLEAECDTALPKDNKGIVQNVTMAGTTFKCWPGTPLFYVVAGEVDGSTMLKMKRGNGSDVGIMITYRNLGFNPSESTFAQVMATFKSK